MKNIKNYLYVVVLIGIVSVNNINAIPFQLKRPALKEILQNYKEIIQAHGIVLGAIPLAEKAFGPNARLRESAVRGMSYAAYYNNKGQCFTNNSTHQKWADIIKNFGESSIHPIGYVGVDYAVSDLVDKVSELELVQKGLNNFSQDNQQFFKDQATVAASALVIEGFTRGISMNQHWSGYCQFPGRYRKPVCSVVAEHAINSSLNHFVINPYVTKPLKENVVDNLVVDVAVQYAYFAYVAPCVAQAVKYVFG